MIKADPNVVQVRRFRIIYLGCVSLMALLVVAIYFTSGPTLLFWCELIAVLILIPLAVFSTTLQGRLWNRFEQRRNRAAQSDLSLLAEEQPIPNAAVLPLPFTIQSPVTGERILSSGGRATLVGLVVAVVVAIPFIVFALAMRAFRPGTLLFGEASFVMMIMFLFAMVAMIRVARTREVVRWQRMGRLDGRRAFAGTPGISYEEYERQMQVLLSLVAAKTGLPLYDLRKGER